MSEKQIENASISFRIGPGQWLEEDRFRNLLALFGKYQGVTDQFSFFTSETHPPLPLAVLAERCQVLAERLPQVRALGYGAGINVLSTVGHCDENLPNSLKADYTHMTKITGATAPSAYCPSDPGFQDYVRQLYRLVAAADPDFIWIDDDVRLERGGGPECFCDRCLAAFAQESGTEHTRESLRKAIAEGPTEARMAVRQAWLAHNRGAILRLLGLIESTVHDVKPGLPLGMMTGERFYEGYDFAQWAGTLAGPGDAPVYWRPGGGFYTDSSPGEMLYKSHGIGRQVSLLPPSVTTIQSEIENFPYQTLRKSAQATALEAVSHMAAGCTGAAFNVLPFRREPLAEYAPMVARLHRARPFLDRIARTAGRAEATGVRWAWNRNAVLTADLLGGDWFGQASGNPLRDQDSQILGIGLPAAYAGSGALVNLLSRQSVAMCDDDEIKEMLSGGVYTDAETLTMLNERGFGELTGLAVERVLPVDCIEELTPHPLNGPLAGRQRDARQSFHHVPGHHLKTTDPGAEALARLIDYGGRETAATSMAVFENQRGGRLCVCGYFPWSFLHTQSKCAQTKSVMRWLSRDRLPAYVTTYHLASLWARPLTNGGLAVVLVNTSFDPAVNLEVALLASSEQITVVDMDGNERVVQEGGHDVPYRRFALPRIEPWSARLLVVGETE